MEMKLPTVGSEVEVVTKARNINAFTSHSEPYTYRKLRGTVLKNDRWVPADSFTLNTGTKEYPVSVISANLVDKITVIAGGQTSVRNFKVSGSKSGQTYIVTKNGDSYSCECVGFKYNSRCKHILAVKQSLEKS